MPIVDFLFVLPLWLLGTLLITLLVGIGLTALWAARRWVLPRLRITYNDANFAVAAVQSMVLLYGLIAALIAVGVWQRHSAASDVVSAEATAIANLWRDLGGYPEPTRTASRDVLRDYTQQIIHEAWPLQQAGKIPTEGVAWMDRLQGHLFAFEPAKDSQRIVHAEALHAFNGLVQCRRQRLDCVRSALPSVFWLVLLPGAIACTCMFVFFHVDNGRFHAVLVSAVAMFFALVLFVIVALDRPFFGAMGIPPNSYHLIYDHHMLK
jgi:hypothetical protein